MEIDITFLLKEETWDVVGSVATHGPANLFPHAVEASANLFKDVDPDLIREYLGGYTQDWANVPDDEARAILLQDIVLTMRECGLEECLEPEDFDWEEYLEEVERGTYSSQIFKSEDGKIYFSLGV